jgi:anion-transporting  ArsA/GET3 family ATPase
MALILTFLGKGGTGRSTLAIATAKHLAQQGRRVLLAIQETGPVASLILGQELSPIPQDVGVNLQGVQLSTSALLERNWEELKQQEAKYLRSPFFQSVYGQELGILPGMDSALALNCLREYDNGGNYDTIVYDGLNDQTTLRMLGMPEILNWYSRRFQEIFKKSDISNLLMPIIQPFLSTILNVGFTGETVTQPAAQAKNLLDQGQAAVGDPTRVAAYLISTSDPIALARAKYLWGCAQQVGLTVGGLVLNTIGMNSEQAVSASQLAQDFSPLVISPIPHRQGGDWQPLQAALPDFQQATQAPRPISIQVAERTVRLFLPGFDKNHVKLSQTGPEITIEAGDQRRNLFLPPELSGRSATGAKFQDDYLTIFL